MKQTSITKTLVISDDDAPKLPQAKFDPAKLRVADRSARTGVQATHQHHA
jgi:hypothetical protein